MECIQFKKPEILRNMMGLLGNVAEVKHLRSRLCKPELITTFRQLLSQANDGIEIAYNSAGVLVHIMSDGVSAWSVTSGGGGDTTATTTAATLDDRDTVIRDIETAIDKWDINSDRNINYRSFQPIFRLVEQFENPICQRWSCWALANLTTVYRNCLTIIFFFSVCLFVFSTLFFFIFFLKLTRIVRCLNENKAASSWNESCKIRTSTMPSNDIVKSF